MLHFFCLFKAGKVELTVYYRYTIAIVIWNIKQRKALI